MASTDGTDAGQPSWTVKYAASTLERMVRTFLVVFVGRYIAALIAGNTSALSDLSFAQTAAMAGLATAATLLLSLLGKGVGNTDTPSLLPRKLDPAVQMLHRRGGGTSSTRHEARAVKRPGGPGPA